MKYTTKTEYNFYLEYGIHEIFFHGYYQDGKYFPLGKVIYAKGFTREKAINHFLKKVKAFSINSKLWFLFNFSKCNLIEKSNKSLNEQALYMYKQGDCYTWSNRKNLAIRANGKTYNREENKLTVPFSGRYRKGRYNPFSNKVESVHFYVPSNDRIDHTAKLL